MDHKLGYAKGGNSSKKNMIAMEIFISLTYEWYGKVDGMKKIKGLSKSVKYQTRKSGDIFSSYRVSCIQLFLVIAPDHTFSCLQCQLSFIP